MKEKKESVLKNLLAYGGKHSKLTYIGMVLSGISAVVGLFRRLNFKICATQCRGGPMWHHVKGAVIGTFLGTIVSLISAGYIAV